MKPIYFLQLYLDFLWFDIRFTIIMVIYVNKIYLVYDIKL